MSRIHVANLAYQTKKDREDLDGDHLLCRVSSCRPTNVDTLVMDVFLPYETTEKADHQIDERTRYESMPLKAHHHDIPIHHLLNSVMNVQLLVFDSSPIHSIQLMHRDQSFRQTRTDTKQLYHRVHIDIPSHILHISHQ